MKSRKSFIRILMSVSILFGLFSFLQAQTSDSIEGIWLGTLKVPGAELRISLTISKTDSEAYKATMNSIDQGSGELVMDQVVYEQQHLKVKGTQIGIEFEGDVDFMKKIFFSEFRQGPARFPVEFSLVDKLPEMARPQEPERPFPYKEEQVEYNNADGSIKFAGTLTMPESGGPFPAVMLLTGSGAQNRDEDIFGHKPFLVLADYLTRQGIAVLRVDDRGIGGTTGNFEISTTADFADDALTGVHYLQTRKEIVPEKIGLVGHSEGGIIAPIAAGKSKDVAFIVLMAGVGIRFDDVILHQKEGMWRRNGLSKAVMQVQRDWHNQLTEITIQDISNEQVAKEIRDLYASLPEANKTILNKTPEALENEIKWMTSPWHRYVSKINPDALFAQVKCPVLAINGTKDMQVNAAANLAGIEKALKAGGNTHYEIKELPGLNHVFQTAETGDEMEYSKIEETQSPLAMQTIGEWIKIQVGK